LNITYCL